MPKDQNQLIIAEHIFEARYDPIGTFLDVRGHIAEHVARTFPIRHWRIDQNRIDFHDEDEGIKQIGAFVSFRNAGVLAYDPPTRNFFEDKAEAFWKSLLLSNAIVIPDIKRLGVRTKAFLKLETPFEQIKETITQKLFSENVNVAFGSKPTDVSVTVDLQEKEQNIRLTVGPIHQNEANRFFRFHSSHFESAGVFVDCDVYDSSSQGSKGLSKALRAGARIAWEKTDLVFDKLGV